MEKVETYGYQKPIDFYHKMKDKSLELMEKVFWKKDDQTQEDEIKMKVFLNSNESAVVVKKNSNDLKEENLKEDFDSKFISFSGSKKAGNIKVFEKELRDFEMVETEEIVDPLKNQSYQGIIGLGPNNKLVENLYNKKMISSRSFYFFRTTGGLTFGEYRKNEVEKEGQCNLS